MWQMGQVRIEAGKKRKQVNKSLIMLSRYSRVILESSEIIMRAVLENIMSIVILESIFDSRIKEYKPLSCILFSV